MTGLLELADGCEQATGPDRDMDSAIAIALGAVSVDLSMTGSGTAYYENASCPLARFTASLDAAMTLVPDIKGAVRNRLELKFGHEKYENPNCFVEALWWHEKQNRDIRGVAIAATMPLALCAAALRARAQLTLEPKQ